MIHGDMRTYSNGRKKKYNAWSKKSDESKQSKRPFVEYKPSSQGYRRGDTSHIPSYVGTGHSCGRIDSPVYSGTLVKGISTMHKSNAVPIIDDQEAKDHASMRR